MGHVPSFNTVTKNRLAGTHFDRSGAVVSGYFRLAFHAVVVLQNEPLETLTKYRSWYAPFFLALCWEYQPGHKTSIGVSLICLYVIVL